MSTRSLMLTSFAVVASIAAMAAQTQGPARDGRAALAMAKGTSELAVTVSTDEQQSQPLRRVSVSIQAGELDLPNIGVTDDEGRVVFRELAAGNYTLTAVRPGYVRTFYGSSAPGRGPGVAVTVLEGQHVGGVRIRMLRGSVITGIVRNTSGQPAPNRSVQASLVRSSGGERRAINVEGGLGMATTDDRGMYRIFGLAPGDYLVSVPTSALASQDMRPMTMAELQWADKVVAADAAAGGSPSPNPIPAPGSGPTVAYSPVYYPGTTVPTSATVVTLGPGEERRGVDFALQLVPTAEISGRVVDAEGRPQRGLSISVRPTNQDGLDLFSTLLNVTGRTGTDGTFTVPGVRPGGYTVSVKATLRADTDPTAAANPADEARQAIAAMMGGATGFTHWASEDVVVAGREVTGMTLTLRPGMTVSGKIVYEATTKSPPADLSKTTLTLATVAADGRADPGAAAAAAILGSGSVSAKVEADGTFAIGGVSPGKYRLTTGGGLIPAAMINAIPGAWTLKSVMAGGRDIADAFIEIKAGTDVSGVVVTFTDLPAELSGTVIDQAGRVTPNFPIIVFSTDRAYWTPASRRVVTARPASDGKFKVTGLPAGEYYVCAVTAVERTEVYDPAFLEPLVPVAFKITIADGEKKTQDLRLGGGLRP